MNDVPVLPPVAHTERSTNDRRIFGDLIEIRAACQYLQQIIDDLPSALSLLPGDQRQAHLKDALNGQLLHRVALKVEGPLENIRRLFASSVKEFEWGADQITLIELQWADLKHSLHAAVAAHDSMDGSLKKLSDQLDQIVFICASLTLSPRINDVMQNLRVGQVLDIDVAFGKELPKNPALRECLLKDLAQQSAVLNSGVFDLGNRIIYKSATTRREQMNSAWHLAGLLMLGFVIPFVFAFTDKLLQSWPFQRSDLHWLLADYVLILVGSGAHFAIEAIKMAKARVRPSFQAVTNWVLWINVRESQIRTGILYLFVGYILLVFGVHQMSWISAFFAGYSIDSVTELFLERFAAIVSTKTKELTKLAQ